MTAEQQQILDKPRQKATLETLYIAGGCLWGVQEFVRHLPGVVATEAGRANGSSKTTQGPYDGYAECVKVDFDNGCSSIDQLMACFFEIIDPYSLNQQGEDVGKKYRTGVYSEQAAHLQAAQQYIQRRADFDDIVVEILPLNNYVKSDEEHQYRLSRSPSDYCHIPKALLHKYKS